MAKVGQGQEGALSFFQFVGIPRSWLSKRPKLPSRNWLIFLGFTSSLTSAYIYDRRQCKKLKQEYIDKVKHLADVPMQSWQFPRKVTVYTTKWPGDDDPERGAIYFKKYVKPVLVAAAIDYTIISGNRHGDLVRTIAAEIKSQRRRAANLDPLSPGDEMLGPRFSSPESKARRLLEGGSVILGRSTYKEYMQGLHVGWTDGLQKVDEESEMAQSLSEDNAFDEPAQLTDEFLPNESPSPIKGTPNQSPFFSPLQLRQPPQLSVKKVEESIPLELHEQPGSIPKQPPLMLVTFLNRVGFLQIPMMIVDFFKRRADFRNGGDAALAIIQASRRPLQQEDKEWGTVCEQVYKSNVGSLPSEIAKAQKSFYKDLPGRLEKARELSRGLREPTKEEVNYPPPTEVELRAERLKKELRWRRELEGWEVVKPEADVVWDERFGDALEIFTPTSLTYFQEPISDNF